MKKIILSMMFAFAFLIPYVKADVEITEATVNLPSVLPQENGDIVDEYSVPSGSNYEPADWFNSGKLRVHYTDDGYGYLSGKYYGGEEYSWSAIICPKEGYSFRKISDGFVIHVNGIDIDNNENIKYYNFTENGGTCRGIEIDFKKLAGTERKFLTVPNNDNEEVINSEVVYDVSVSVSGTIILQKYYNYEWTDINSFAINAEEVKHFTIPSVSEVGGVSYRLVFTDGALEKIYSFTVDYKDPSKMINHVELTLPTYPVLGGDIISEYRIPEDVNYEKASWFVDGKMRVHFDGDGYGEETGKYKSGKYEWTAIVCPKDGYSFVANNNELEFVVNGIDLNSDKIEYHSVSVNGNTCRGLNITFKNLVDLTIVKPEVSIKSENNKVTLTWLHQDGAKKYEVYRSTDNKKFKRINTVSEDSYVDKSLTYGVKYYYKVKAYDGKKWSGYSNVVSKKIAPKKMVLNTYGEGSKNIKLSWEKVSVTGYEIYSSTDNKKWTKVTTITKNGTLNYNVKKLKPNKTYYFKARAYKTVNKKKVYGSYSNVIYNKTTVEEPTLSLSIADLGYIYSKVGASKGAKTYHLEKSVDGVNYELLKTMDEATTVTSSLYDFNVKYYFRVKACTEEKCSKYTTASILSTTKTPGFSIKTSSKKVTITMSKVNGADGYQIYSSTKKKGKYSKIKEFSSEVELLEYVNKTTKGKTYYYKVRSFKLNESEKRVYSPYSKIKSIKSK